MTTLYLICFVLGLVMSLMAVFTGLGRAHLGHIHLGHIHFGHGHVHTHTPANGGQISALNGFTLPAFLCWFGGAGYLLHEHSSLFAPLAFALAAISGFIGAAMIYLFLFKFLLPRERVLSSEDTRMDGIVAQVSNEIRADGGIGEILFSQTGARRGAAAKSETGVPIARGTEVVVLHYTRGIAYVRPLHELNS